MKPIKNLFTLIELIVVMAIIAIIGLAIAGVVIVCIFIGFGKDAYDEVQKAPIELINQATASAKTSEGARKIFNEAIKDDVLTKDECNAIIYNATIDEAKKKLKINYETIN